MLACALALLPAAAPASTLDRAGLIRLSASVVRVEAARAQGGYSLGSGVVVGPGKVATNCHVTREGRTIHVVRGGQRWPADGQASDPHHDLCVLSVPLLEAPAVPLGDTHALQPGERVSAVGFTGGMGLQHSAGKVVARHRLDSAEVIQSTNWFNSGASGGGLFDGSQRLVGILTFRLRGSHAHYYAASVEWLQPLLDDGALRSVQPLTGSEAPFWEQPLPDQPRFLQAAVYEREQRWEDLDALATAWAEEDTTDAQPWVVRGLAQQELGRWPAAQASLEQALAIEPASRSALLRLGLLHAAQGRIDSARALLLRLQRLHSELAAELGRAIEGR
ncbi:trypsin-like peptidase domain-containing protein [Aquincola sp. MAHUQ-54]|uniref:Trypsin-like peptidase domain-containing protein n=1 Tax=Aquincola agrisoli TaxID=3119538 RepID=A0AAW9QA03_9BURK